MDYEKKYKEALEWLREGLYPATRDEMKEEMERYFPELKESGDERIRNFLIDLIKVCGWTEKKDQGWPLREECLAWLEKQGEHSNFRNKIQIGDKVTRNKDGMLVNLSQLNRVAKKQGEQKPIGKPTLDIEIPFGMDSELVEETMTIPKGCYAVIEDNKVVIRKGEMPAEWSEEDEKILDSIIGDIYNADALIGGKETASIKCSWLKNKLKSLKDTMKL